MLRVVLNAVHFKVFGDVVNVKIKITILKNCQRIVVMECAFKQYQIVEAIIVIKI